MIDASTSTNTSLPITGTVGRDVKSPYLGKNSDDGSGQYDYDGKIDEFRASKVARSTEWLNATYHTIADDEFLSVNSASDAVIELPTVTTNATIDITTTTATINGFLLNDGNESCNTWLEWDDYNISELNECAGFMATGTVCVDGRSLLMKNRHGTEGEQQIRFHSGDVYNMLCIGFADALNNGKCRMVINEVGLCIANFDGGDTALLNGEIDSDKSLDEDEVMCYAAGNYSTVSDAAMFIAQHAGFDAQYAIISKEPGVGAIVAVDPNVATESNITYVNNTWIPLVNEYYCDNNNDDNEKQARIEYLANHILAGNGLDPIESSKFLSLIHI